MHMRLCVAAFVDHFSPGPAALGDRRLQCWTLITGAGGSIWSRGKHLKKRRRQAPFRCSWPCRPSSRPSSGQCKSKSETRQHENKEKWLCSSDLLLAAGHHAELFVVARILGLPHARLNALLDVRPARAARQESSSGSSEQHMLPVRWRVASTSGDGVRVECSSTGPELHPSHQRWYNADTQYDISARDPPTINCSPFTVDTVLQLERVFVLLRHRLHE